MAQLRDMRLAGCIANDCFAVCHHSRHDRILRCQYTGLIQQNISAIQPPGLELEDLIRAIKFRLSTHSFEREQMGVYTATADYITAGGRQLKHTSARQHWAS